jgi:DNA-binding MarR family transcriptional regulator/N-acetylglutamate synthase-like GNAT family acetyltransferase
MDDPAFVRRVAAVRRFNRFYTRQIGILDANYLASPYSLAEVRVLYELNYGPPRSAAGLSRDLGLDPGYLSRILRRFEKAGLIERTASVTDARRSTVSLTGQGRAEFAPLDRRSAEEIGGLLGRLGTHDQARLVDAMATVERLLGAPSADPTLVLRQPEPGDLGWVVERHGAIYSAEYGYDERFEALVAEIVAHFVQELDTKRERCWIAELDGQPVGCVFLVKASDEVGKLRLFLVEPSARGRGVGGRLVDECVRFARRVGYRKVTLWTQSELLAARRVYARAGFRCVAEESNKAFGRDDLVSETWELEL